MTFTVMDRLKPILKGKPNVLYNAEFRLTLQGGSLTSEDQWIEQFPNGPTVIIELDGVIIYSGQVKTECVELNFNVVDTANLQEHILKIKLSGLDRTEWSNDLNPMLKILKMQLEQLDLETTFENLANYIHESGNVEMGSRYMGCNGHQELTFTTPIYNWLLENYNE